MNHRLRLLFIVLFLMAIMPPTVLAECPTNSLANPGFEDGKYKGEQVGTSLSSWVSVGWLPWAVLGDAQVNREIEFFVADSAVLEEGNYRVHGGRYAQKFFSGFSTHHAGFYQRVPVVPGSQVTFSIWTQIATGQQERLSNGLPVSDLEEPGNYRVWAGIDPLGDTPPGFGAPPSPNTVWSDPVIDRETRQITSDKHEIDAWVQLTVSTIAQSDHVTVYSKGQPEFPVKNNSSFWDDACLVVVPPPTATPRPTDIPTATPSPTHTPEPTGTLVPTPTALPTQTETSLPTETVMPTATSEPSPTQVAATHTTLPVQEIATTTATAKPDATPTQSTETSSRGPTQDTNTGVLLIYAGIALLVVVMVVWLRLGSKS